MTFTNDNKLMTTIVPIHDTGPIFPEPKPFLGTTKIKHQPIINQIANHWIHDTTGVIFLRKESEEICGILAGYIYEGDGSGYWDISLDFLTPVERNENALSRKLF